MCEVPRFPASACSQTKSVSYTFPKKNLTVNRRTESGAPAGHSHEPAERGAHRPPVPQALRLLRPNLELDLPAPIGIDVLHPQFQRARSVTTALTAPGSPARPGTRPAAGSSISSRLVSSSSRSASGSTCPSRRRCAPARRRTGNPPSARYQAELAALDHQVRALLHALRHDAQRLDRRADSRGWPHRGLQTDVVSRAAPALIRMPLPVAGAARRSPRPAPPPDPARTPALRIGSPPFQDASRSSSRARIGSALNTPPLNSTAVGISAAAPARSPTRAASFSLDLDVLQAAHRGIARCAC